MRKVSVTGFLCMILLSVLVNACASPSVIVRQGDYDRGTYEGYAILGKHDEKSVALRNLCGGDLHRILSSSTMAPADQLTFERLACGPNADQRAFHDFYKGLPDDLRIEILQLFRANDYYIQGYG